MHLKFLVTAVTYRKSHIEVVFTQVYEGGGHGVALPAMTVPKSIADTLEPGAFVKFAVVHSVTP
jgi:hypothetical protein